MEKLKITELEIKGLKLLEPKYFEDNRGWFCETYSMRTMKEAGIDTVFVQDNHSLSMQKGIIRGIHFQNNPKPQAKLVRCTRGKIMDYAVDLRKNSPTFKKWLCIELSEKNRRQLFIPEGFGHAFITLEENCEVQYKTNELYYPEYDRSIKWNDPEINIDWGINCPVISEKDNKAPLLSESDINFSIEDNP